MTHTWQLQIGRAAHAFPPMPGTRSWKTIQGGPLHLLGWLEDQLGLTGARGVREISATDRIQRYGNALASTDGDSYRESFTADRWATAAELLRRRDELLLAGWEPQRANGSSFPHLVSDLAEAESHFDAPGVPDRLALVEATIREPDVELPPHELKLTESPDQWPPLWARVLAHLDLTVEQAEEPSAPSETMLGAVQRELRGGEIEAVPRDGSLHWLTASSVHGATQTLATALAGTVTSEHMVTIYCADASTALQLEEACRRLELPALGAQRSLAHHPALQILPLVLELSWKPVDPQVLMDFLSLPVSPIPASARRALARSLSEFPGLGSRSWDEAWERCIDQEPETESRLNDWLQHRREPAGDPLPTDVVEERCGVVSRWARGYAEQIEKAEDDPVLGEALRTVAAQASALSALVEEQAGPATKPQLFRMLDDVRASTSLTVRHPLEVGAPRLITSLADVPDETDHLVWLGVGTEELVDNAWTERDLEALQDNGIAIDNGRRDLHLRRAAERRGLQSVGSSLTVIELPADAERPAHPLWTRIKTTVSSASREVETPALLDEAIAGEVAFGPWSLAQRTLAVEPLASPPTSWEVSAGLLCEPDTSSATELEERLACPLRWVLGRMARIRRGDTARMPDEFRLRGNFAHAVLEDVFGEGGDLPSPEDAVRLVTERFDERLALDAAPLAQPAKVQERAQLREELAEATRVLVTALQRGSYRVVAGEVPLTSELDGRPLIGSIDLVVEQGGDEAIVDFKYGGQRRYPTLLEEGRAVQLAVYAFDRAGESSAPDPTLDAVAYLIIKAHRFVTPQGSPLEGAEAQSIVSGAPAISTTWTNFQDALRRSDAWLVGDEPVPVRPRQDPDQWPAGVDMVVETEGNSDRTELRPCRYCDFDLLCGLTECE